MEEGARQEERDATRRTRLASERTYLAWWRSGLTALAVSFAAGKLVPELSEGSTWAFQALGVGFGLLGIAFIVVAFQRQRAVELALRQGEYAPLGERFALALMAVGVLLGASTVLLVILSA